MFGTGYGFGPPKGPPEGARDASRPKVVVLTKSYKAKTHLQRTFLFTDFQGVQKGPPWGAPLVPFDYKKAAKVTKTPLEEHV